MQNRHRLAAALATLATCCLLLTAATTGLAASRVDALAASMSLEEKVGQIFMVWFAGPTLSTDLAAIITQRHLGGVILYDKPGNIASAEQLAALTASIQAAAATTGHGLGLLVGVDQEGGPVARLRDGFTVFPSQMALAATGNRTFARQAARITGRELAAVGINTDFAPVADVNVNPANPVIGIRSFGEHPATVSRFVAAATAGYADAGVICTPKHFPGHGDTAVDSHVGLPRVDHDLATLRRVDFPPFRAGIQAGAPAVMTAHVLLPAVEPDNLPSTLSKRVLLGILRGKLGFDGVIFTDSLGMGAVADTYGTAEAAVRALEAGADILLVGADAGRPAAERLEAMDRIVQAVREGRVPQARLDAAVSRVLRLKKRFGLLDAKALATPLPDAAARCGTPANLALAERMAVRSLTAFGPTTGILPLPAAQTTLVVRPRLGRETTDAPVETTLASWSGVRTLFTPADPDDNAIEAARREAAGADHVVVLATNAGKNAGQRRLVEALAGASRGHMVIVAAESPYDLAVLPTVATRLAIYGEARVSLEALRQALFTRFHFTGRCPVTITPQPGATDS